MRKRYVPTIGTVAACLLAVLLLSVGRAAAGGPTSVLLVSPGDGRTAALYNDDGAYSQLMDLLGSDPVAEPGGPSWQSNPGTSQINVTWLIHDVSVWRVDRIVLNYKGATWIETVGSLTETFDWEQPGKWHKAKDPATLRALLTKLGVVAGPAPAKQKQQKQEQKSAIAAEPSVAPAVAQTPPAESSGGLPWWWLLPTAVAGLALGAAARPALARLRTRQPRQELIDVTP
jgi:hypothetical protein